MTAGRKWCPRYKRSRKNGQFPEKFPLAENGAQDTKGAGKMASSRKNAPWQKMLPKIHKEPEKWPVPGKMPPGRKCCPRYIRKRQNGQIPEKCRLAQNASKDTEGTGKMASARKNAPGHKMLTKIKKKRKKWPVAGKMSPGRKCCPRYIRSRKNGQFPEKCPLAENAAQDT